MLHPHRVLRPYSAGRKSADLDCAARRAVSSLAATDFVVVDLDGADLGAVGWGGATMEEPELEPELSLATSVLPQLVGGLQRFCWLAFPARAAARRRWSAPPRR